MGSSPFVQAALPIKVTTPLGSDKLLVLSLEGDESISGLFFYRVEFFSEDSALDFSQIVGKSISLNIGLTSGGSQYVNGIAGRFSQSGRDKRFTRYIAEIRPLLWTLTMNADCKIFQNKSVPDIIKQVFSDLGFTAFKDSLTATYQPRDYCVQYRETAFAFISRLMEEEGIFYFFTHESSSHTMVLADDTNAWATCTGLTAARYGGIEGGWDTDDVITECSVEQAVTVGEVKADDFNFVTPSTDLLSTASGSDTSRSIYDYPGLYTAQSDGETITSRRLAAFEVDAKGIRGSSLCRSFHAGAKFTMSGHYRADANADYVIRRLHVHANIDAYTNTFEAFPSTVTFRPPVTVARPIIAGTQTATVVGKAGEEIWTDEYGRITVQFHWDQLGKKNETSSCWIRVSQGWAGKLWGGIYIPRVGQEVVVSFLEGNPDRPLVTGCVYNAENTVPYTLPDDQTKSTMKSNTSKGGEGFNELRFEDKAGSEEVFLHAQKDLNFTVLGNETGTVTGNYSLTVKGNLSINVTGAVLIKAGGTLDTAAGTALTNTAGTELVNKAETNMTNQAGASLTNKAGASQTVDGGGMLTLKGGLVKIN